MQEFHEYHKAVVQEFNRNFMCQVVCLEFNDGRVALELGREQLVPQTNREAILQGAYAGILRISKSGYAGI